MAASAPQGSIVRKESGRADLLAFDVLGKIPVSDMDWMAAQVDEAFSAFEEVDMLLVMRNFEGADVASAIDPKVVKVQLRSLGKVRRYAVVGAPAWARAMIEFFDIVIPVDAKTFDRDEEAEARRWVDERPAS